MLTLKILYCLVNKIRFFNLKIQLGELYLQTQLKDILRATVRFTHISSYFFLSIFDIITKPQEPSGCKTHATGRCGVIRGRPTMMAMDGCRRCSHDGNCDIIGSLKNKKNFSMFSRYHFSPYECSIVKSRFDDGRLSNEMRTSE